MEEQEAPPLIKRSELAMQRDLDQPSIQGVMKEFAERIWKRGATSALEQAIVELRGREMHPAADILEQMREP